MDNRMSIEELYDYLRSPQFLDEKSGNIFYNYYIYQYPACDEYKIRQQIQVYCNLRFTEDELAYIDKIRWITAGVWDESPMCRTTPAFCSERI